MPTSVPPIRVGQRERIRVRSQMPRQMPTIPAPVRGDGRVNPAYIFGGLALLGLGIVVARSVSGSGSGVLTLVDFERKSTGQEPLQDTRPPPSITEAYPFASFERLVIGSQLINTQEAAFRNGLPNDKARSLAHFFLDAADATGLSPFWIAAIAEVESRYGVSLCCAGSTRVGSCPDTGFGCIDHDDQGIMQVNRRYHGTVTGVEANILKGAQILRANWDFFKAKPAGSMVTVPKGATQRRLDIQPGEYPDPRADPRYQSVMDRFYLATAAYNAGMGGALWAAAAGLSPDAATYGGNYVSKVSIVLNRLGNRSGLWLGGGA